jgi:hypothetical protein
LARREFIFRVTTTTVRGRRRDVQAAANNKSPEGSARAGNLLESGAKMPLYGPKLGGA